MPFRCCCRSRDHGWEASNTAARPASISLVSPSQPNNKTQTTVSWGASRVLGLSQPTWESPSTPMSGSQLTSGGHHPPDDDFDSDDDGPRSRKKVRGTLDSVRSKLFQRHLQGTDMRRPSPASIGNTDEEVARRAELKRLMHKRIQDELSSEQDDDKPDQKPTPGSQGLSPVALHSTGPRDHIEFSVSTPQTLDSPTVLQSGPKVTITLSHDESKDIPVHEDKHAGSSLGPKNSEQPLHEVTGTVRCLCPEIVSTELVPGSRRASVPHSIISQRSFQLSNNTPRLERILGPDNGFSNHSASSVGGHSALGIWLIAQGLRSRENSSLPLGDSENSNPPLETQDLTKASDMSVHNTPTSDVETHLDRSPSAVSASSRPEQQSGSMIRDIVESSKGSPFWSRGSTPIAEDVLDGEALVAILNSVADNTSSSYNSKKPSFQPSPSRSQSVILKLNAQDVESLKDFASRGKYL